jgi:hypothetical protein
MYFLTAVLLNDLTQDVDSQLLTINKHDPIESILLFQTPCYNLHNVISDNILVLF